MKLVLSVPILRATYDLLAVTKPFSGWKLPNSAEVEFEVMKTMHLRGECDGEKIRISASNHASLGTLMVTMAHEICHLYQYLNGIETPNTVHNADFRKRLQRVCAYHGFDFKAAL